VTIVKRINRVRQPQEGETNKGLTAKSQQTYEVVRKTELEEKPLVKVVLKEFVEGFGDAGDVIDVVPEKARYDLILPGFAEYATPDALERGKLLAAMTTKKRYSSKFSPLTCRMIGNRVFRLYMSDKNPWKLEAWHVRVALRQGGLIATDEAVCLPEEVIEGPSDEVFDKDVIIKLLINGQDEVPCRFRICEAKQRVTLAEESDEPWFLRRVEPLFPSQSDLIEEMHQAVLTKLEAVKELRRSKACM